MRKLLFLLLLSTVYLCANTFTLSNRDSSASLQPYGKVFVDTNNTLKPQDILNLTPSSFTPASNKISKPYLSTIWFVVDVQNSSESARELCIYNSIAATDYLDFYVFDGDKLIKHSTAGDLRSFRDRELPTLYGFVSLSMASGKKLTVVAKYANQGRMQPAFFVEQSSNFVFANAAEIFSLTLMLGFLAAISSYNLIAFIASKNKLYGLYFVHVFAMLLFYLIVFGFLNIVFPKSILETLNHSDRFIAACGGIFFALFFALFFNTKNNYPKIHKLIIGYVAIYSSLAIFGAYISVTNSIIPATMDGFMRPLYLVYTLSMFASALFMAYKKQKYASLIALAIACHIITTSIIIALLTENVEHAYWQAPVMLFGYILEVACMSFALGMGMRELDLKLKNSVIQQLQSEQARQKDREQLIHSEKMAQLGSMLGAILHQWKQPLNSISLEAQYIKMGCDEEELSGGLDNILQQVNFMSKTADEFRDFYKPSKKSTQFEIKKEIDSIITLLHKQLSESSIAVSIEAGEELYTIGYPQEFKHIILNIINNAKDQLQANQITSPFIDIRIFKRDNKAIIQIEDNAGGIDKELLPDAIFEPFVSTKQDKGTGIGLSLCKTIIEEHMDGKITASNTKNGAMFEIVLPL